MIDLHYAPTPNGWKITIMLEECGLPYTVVPMQLGRGDQHQPDFLKLSPNGRMPAIVDHAPADGGADITMFESGAILIYLAEKSGRFMPADQRGRFKVTQWVMWQMGGLGPMLGQNGHFLLPMPSIVTLARRSGSMACSMRISARGATISPAIIPSPTWSASPGS
jgi:GST-like protein